MTLRDRMARDALAIARADHHGETVVFHAAAGGDPRSFLAVPNRDRLAALGRDPDLGAAAREATVFLPRNADPALGVEVVEDGDELEVVLQLGKPAVRCRIAETLSEDDGGFLVRVQK